MMQGGRNANDGELDRHDDEKTMMQSHDERWKRMMGYQYDKMMHEKGQ